MNFALLWLDALVVSLLWVATVSACVARIKTRWIRGAFFPLAVGVPLVFLAILFFGGVEMKSLFVACLLGISLVRRLAAHRQPGLPPAAATWPRLPLALACAVALGVGFMTLLNMDLAIRARCAIQSLEINSLYLATLPAITSDAQNAAPIYEKAFARLRGDPPTGVNNPPIGNSTDFDPNETATVAFLARHAATIALLRQAAALPGCRFDQDLSASDMTAMMSGLNQTRLAADCLALQAHEEIARGQISSAISDAFAILAMSRHFGQRPLLISALVGFSLDSLGNRTLEQALAAARKPADLSALHLDELSSPGRFFQQALRGEERYGLSVFGNMPASRIETVNGNSLPVQETRPLASAAGPAGAFFRVFYLDSDAYMNLMDNLQNLSIQPYYRIRDQLTAIHDSKNAYGLLTSILIPSLTKAFESCGLAEAGDACAQTAVAMTRFKLEHGTYPSNLNDLVPAYLDEIPTDPFDGQPIKLIVKGNQWILHSAGPGNNPSTQPVFGMEDVIFSLDPAP